MRRDHHPRHTPGRLRQLLGLGLSGAALAALVYVETVSAHGEVETSAEEWSDTGVDTKTFEALAPALVVVPDLTGMRLRSARRELRALGLRIRVRDSYNDTIPRDYWSDYKVRKQRIEPGTEVTPGAKIRLVARERYRVSQGY